MTYDLIKYSSPGGIEHFNSKDELIDALRSHICSSCRVGPSIDEWDDHTPLVDIEYQGKWYYCRDIATLLGTPCGCEYGVEIDGKMYWEQE